MFQHTFASKASIKHDTNHGLLLLLFELLQNKHTAICETPIRLRPFI